MKDYLGFVKRLIIAMMTITTALLFFGWIVGYSRCISKSYKDVDKTVECLVWFAKESPPVKEAKEIKEACDSSDEECLAKLLEKKALDEMQRDNE